jgi:ABC-2 type transport system permease protein
MVSYTQGIVQNFLQEMEPSSNPVKGIQIESRMMFNQGLKSVFMFVPGTMALILMLISAMMTSISIAREKEMGTMEVLLISPLRPYQIIMGKVFPYIILSFITALIILAMGVGVFKLPIQGSVVLLLAESLLFIVLALSLGILISTMAPNQQVAMFISMFALMLPTILLSGFIFPIENMPSVLQLISHIVPAKYFIIILKNIMLKGTGLLFIWQETLILLGITIMFLVLSAIRFKVRLE